MHKPSAPKWGIGGNSGYGTVEGDWVHYEIPVGDHFTGDFERLVFVNDHDLSPSDGEALFRDVSVHEAFDYAQSSSLIAHGAAVFAFADVAVDSFHLGRRGVGENAGETDRTRRREIVSRQNTVRGQARAQVLRRRS